MSVDVTSAMPSEFEDFVISAQDFTIDADDFMMDLEPNDIHEKPGVVECDEQNCEVEQPSVDNSFQPYIGMEFSCHEEAYKFYNTYGYAKGFSIRRSTCYKNYEDKVTSVRMMCSKQGLNPTQKKLFGRVN